MYKLMQVNAITNKIEIVQRVSDNSFIPFDPNNCDYLKFKTDIVGASKDLYGNTLEASELQDENGNVMTTEQVLEFFHTLP